MRPRPWHALVWTLLILFLCWMPRSWLRPTEAVVREVALGTWNIDKVVHLALFLGFGALWIGAGLRWIMVLLGGLVITMMTEVGQYLVPALERSLHFADILADLVGLVIGVAIGWWIWIRPSPTLASTSPSVSEFNGESES